MNDGVPQDYTALSKEKGYLLNSVIRVSIETFHISQLRTANTFSLSDVLFE